MWAIIYQSLKLFFKSYLDIFPFVLCFIASIHFIDKFAPTFLLKNLMALFPTIFFFSLILLIVFYRYHEKPFRYKTTLLKGIKRFLPAVLAFFIMITPALLIGLLMNFTSQYVLPIHDLANESTPNLETLLATFLMLVLSIAMIAWMVIILYFYFALYFIVIKKASPFKGLKQSWGLIQGHWFKTFFLLFILILMTALLQKFFGMIVGRFVKEVVSLIITPFSAALMIIYHNYLVHQP